jgi:hypothetical protein
MTNNLRSEWDALNRILTVHLNGEISEADVERWRENLEHALGALQPNSSFKLLSDMTGFNAQTMNAHKAMRGVIPLTQAAYGFPPGVARLFDVQDMPITHTRGITLTAAAHVHHDEGKMTEYQTRLGTEREGWFTDPATAREWLLTLV